ncbi:MAG: SIS domain-containing protein [bacterium]
MRGEYSRIEIEDQPRVWNDILNNPPFIEEIKDKEEIIYFGSGTSYYLALSVASFTQHYTGITCRALPSQELVFFPDTIISDRPTLYIGISRSGETSEVILAGEKVKEQGKGDFIGVTTEKNKPLAIISDRAIVIEEAKEKSVVMTKSFTSMLLGIQLGILSVVNPSIIDKMREEINQASKGVLTKAKSWAKEVAKKDYREVIFLGSGPLYGIACESALKVREMSSSITSAFHTLEFRHGPRAALSKDTLVLILLSDSARKEELKIASEIEELGSNCIVIGEKPGLETSLNEFQRTILYMPFSQYLGYYQALEKGLDPDAPLNLTQVVTIA